MRMRYKPLIFSLLIFFTISCGPKKLTDEELAQQHLAKSEKLFNSNEINAAKMQIDTINKFFEKQVAVRKKANTLSYNIQLIEQKKNLIYADSVIKIKQREVDSIAKNFKFEKDTAYEDLGNYVYKSQRVENTLGGTFIRAYVDEKGKLYLSSLYCSKVPLKHFSARFTIGDIFAETEKVTDDGYNHSFKDGEATFETVIYKSNANKEIGTLVQQNSGKTIVVTLQGEKRKATFLLTSNEKKAISEACNLSVYLTDLKNLERIITVSKKKIILLEENLRQDKEDSKQ